jgi:hypothetical protein
MCALSFLEVTFVMYSKTKISRCIVYTVMGLGFLVTPIGCRENREAVKPEQFAPAPPKGGESTKEGMEKTAQADG